MATKTISLRTEAYDRLRSARRFPEESFSQVVLRARWDQETLTGGELLQLLREGEGSLLPGFDLEAIEKLKREDRPPEDKWNAP